MAWHFKSSGTSALMRGTSGRGYWIAQGMEPPEDMEPAPDEWTVGERLDRAREYFAAGDFVLAEVHASAALRLDPTNEQAAEALRLRAVANARTNFFADAIRDAYDALERDPLATTGPVTAAVIAEQVDVWRGRELWKHYFS
jgi:hypothetical protein